MLIGNARVSKVDGSQSLDLQSGVSFLWTPVQLLTASTLHRRTRSTPCQAGMSLALLKLSGDSVHDYATISDDSPSPSCASRARSAATS